ncbi:hypothetical protein [Halorussus caseinilyticus]|uniref:DUF7982 domain-containing protein n=1 Tax=Halorussus caseinilyticus TaxID=3034025 RepID=A0ABD5WEU8_9EURY|nr:hypothetical protein [Halorussus sp. DT72]
MSRRSSSRSQTADADSPGSPGTDRSGDDAVTETERLRARVAVLEEENDKLRREYARSKRARHRRTALGLFAVGALAVVAGLALPASRDVLFALGGTGLFAGVLTYYLTPERFLPASVGESVYAALAENGTAIRAELGLADETVYVPAPERASRDERVFVPRRDDYELPDDESLARTFVTSDDRQRGVTLEPAGLALVAEFERALSGSLAEDPETLADQLADGAAEQFELADRLDADPDDRRVTVGVTGSAFGRVDRFDHPIQSFLGVGLARGLDRPVAVETESVSSSAASASETDADAADADYDYLVTCRWRS